MATSHFSRDTPNLMPVDALPRHFEKSSPLACAYQRQHTATLAVADYRLISWFSYREPSSLISLVAT
jgi:hypothetical protein